MASVQIGIIPDEEDRKPLEMENIAAWLKKLLVFSPLPKFISDSEKFQLKEKGVSPKFSTISSLCANPFVDLQ